MEKILTSNNKMNIQDQQKHSVQRRIIRQDAIERKETGLEQNTIMPEQIGNTKSASVNTLTPFKDNQSTEEPLELGNYISPTERESKKMRNARCQTAPYNSNAKVNKDRANTRKVYKDTETVILDNSSGRKKNSSTPLEESVELSQNKHTLRKRGIRKQVSLPETFILKSGKKNPRPNKLLRQSTTETQLIKSENLNLHLKNKSSIDFTRKSKKIDVSKKLNAHPSLLRQQSVPEDALCQQRNTLINNQSTLACDRLNIFPLKTSVKDSKTYPSTLRKQRLVHSMKERRSKSVDALVFPEVITMVSQTSPIQSDVENNDCFYAVPISQAPNLMRRSNYGLVLQRPAFLTRNEMHAFHHRKNHSAPSKQFDKLEIKEKVSEKTFENSTERSLPNAENHAEKQENEEKAIQKSENVEELSTNNIETSHSEQPEPPKQEEPPLEIFIETTNKLKHLPKIFNKSFCIPSQEKECHSMQEKLHKNGIDVSLRTIQRALLTPTEYRLFFNAERT